MSKTPSSPPERTPATQSGVIALVITLASAAIVVTCGASRQEPAQSPVAATPPPTASSAPPLVSAAAPEPTDIPAVETSPAGPLPRTPGHELDNFFAALRELERGARHDHLRVAWLGDSHGAADFWSGALRTALQKRFGNGGPGFIHAGYKAYRHDAVKSNINGTWRLRPGGPSSISTSGDGVWGLGGIVLAAMDTASRASITIDSPDPLPDHITWDLCYRIRAKDDALVLKLGTDKKAEIRHDPASPLGALRHTILEGAGASTSLSISASGHPELCGLVVEAEPRKHPGVVLDTLGINGARLATPLAWQKDTWVAELSRRAPQLAILEYGTNESGDFNIDPSVYLKNLTNLMTRIHEAAPACDCLVLAPTDRADTQDRTPLVRDALRDAAKAVGCGFWDTYEAMGGKGSIRAWRNEEPARAAPDGVHLTMRGYRELGGKLAEDLLRQYHP